MSDEAQVTPEPGNSTEHAQENWEQRFKDTQAGYTQSQQELADERKVWDDEQAALGRLQEKFPHLFEEAEEEQEYVEPEEAERPLTRAEFEAWKTEQAQQQQAQSQQDQFEADFKAVLNGRDITKHGDRAIRYALNQGEIRNADDLKTAVDEWFSEVETASKPKPRVPHVPANGTAATGGKAMSDMTEAEALAWQVEKAQQLASQR